jgi:hypothetical protein
MTGRLKLSEVRAIYRSAEFAWANNCDGSERDIARYRVRLEVLSRRLAAMTKARDEAVSLAKQATNAMACIARSQYQHREVDRLHQAIAALELGPPLVKQITEGDAA